MHKSILFPFALVGLVAVPIRKDWQALRSYLPGERFECCYRRARGLQERDEVVSRILRVTLAVLAFVVGIGMIFLPLPEIPFFVVSGALLAAESLPFARFLDRAEIRLRDAWGEIKRRLGLPPCAIRVITVCLILTSLALSSGFCYRTFLR
jgi:hypothetical protein